MTRPALDALRLAGFALGALWTSPNTLLGLIAGCAGMPFGARARISRRELALVFDRFPWGPRGALTLGNVILVSADDLDVACATYEHAAGRCWHPNVRLGDHERAHVLQYLLLGPLFLPLYFACGGVGVRNPLERAADRYALHGHGWWPWRR
ncbi:hypothetical protein HEP75_02455 [Xanthomonas sp. SI]|nr:hypothetical protein HEP75_02455 [Xanthomonas sp. SI]